MLVQLNYAKNKQKKIFSTMLELEEYMRKPDTIINYLIIN
jgi:hypothetical protein